MREKNRKGKRGERKRENYCIFFKKKFLILKRISVIFMSHGREKIVGVQLIFKMYVLNIQSPGSLLGLKIKE